MVRLKVHEAVMAFAACVDRKPPVGEAAFEAVQKLLPVAAAVEGWDPKKPPVFAFGASGSDK